MSPSQDLKAVMSTFIVLNAITVGMRLFVRIRLKKAFGWDDTLISIALVSSLRPGLAPLQSISSDNQTDRLLHSVWINLHLYCLSLW
jgi:hypothetical protein